MGICSTSNKAYALFLATYKYGIEAIFPYATQLGLSHGMLTDKKSDIICPPNCNSSLSYLRLSSSVTFSMML